MRTRLVFVLGLLLSIWLTGSVRADYVDSIVLIPDADGGFNTFSDETGCSDHYDCVNDSNDTQCDVETTTYVHGSSGVEQYGHTTAPDTSNALDSMAIYVELAELKSGTSGDSKIEFGWRYKDEGAWYYCENEGGTDTVDLNTKACAVFRDSWTNDPCWGSTRSLGWFFFGWTYDGEASEDYIWQPVVHITSIEGGCLPACEVRCFNLWIVLYFTVMEAEGQVIIIGAKDEENHHNPRRGIPPAAWE